MDNPNSPLDTLRQLKDMLDSGALTPAEFEALKQRLVFTAPTAAPPLPSADGPELLPESLPASSPPLPEQHSPLFEEVAPTAPALPPPPPTPPVNTALEEDFAPEALHPPLPERAVAAPANSPLGLILAIGGVLVFLAVVVYLNYNGRPSERLSSTSMTAADSAATVVEAGPQAEPLPPVAAVPETVRVAPTNPAPVIQPRPARPLRDSAALVPPTDSAAGQ